MIRKLCCPVFMPLLPRWFYNKIRGGGGGGMCVYIYVYVYIYIYTYICNGSNDINIWHLTESKYWDNTIYYCCCFF